MARRGETIVVDWQAAGPWLVLAVGLFYLNDFAFLNADGYRAWLIVDYTTRLLVLAILFAPPALRRVLRVELGHGPALRHLAAASLIAGIAGIAADLLRVPVLSLWPRLDGWTFPPPGSASLHVFDLTFGIALVAVTEELTFRGPLLAMVREGRIGRWAGLIITALVFGAMHWSQGLDNIVAATAVGAILGLAALATRSVWPAILAHYAIDVWHFL